ncbi:MAG: hypothetical protein RMM17_01715 [Acidobacteriota bacterium]|nr:hypothetical protein [Blastocatellia bacterium]MDW8411387.1 hypothetical protein [Acidobacteriota bacterium]
MTNTWQLILGSVIFIAASSLAYYITYLRKQYSKECFDAMLRVLLQPTTVNIEALDKLLAKSKLKEQITVQLLAEAEIEADCVSMMPTGELRSKQPFLEKRYKQILANSKNCKHVSKLISTRLAQVSK